MITIKKILYRNEYVVCYDWGTEPNDKTKSYCEFEMYFDFKEGLRFSACTPNMSYCGRNPFKVLMRLLSQQNKKVVKYEILKDQIYTKGLHKKL